MFNLLRKPKKNGTNLVIQVNGLNCTSCALNIDDTLEQIPGVTSATTSYGKSETVVEFNPELTSEEALKTAITDLGYKVR